MTDRILELVAHHVLLSAAALILAAAISLPLAVAAARRPTLARAALGVASIVQTVPGLALLALFFPLLLALAQLGLPVAPLGFLPALLALTLYALLPMLRNGVAGLTGVDAAVREAADGVGMTARQKLWLVEAPLAAPVIMAGVRTAAVWTIGAATLSTTVGQPSLGDLIFSGLQTQNWRLVLTGCLAAAALALAVDALLGTIESGVRRRRGLRVCGAAALLALGIAASATPLLAPARPTVTIGAKNFSEQFILARLIGLRLERAGYAVRYREGLGSAVIFRALASGEVDVYVDYAGTLWTNEMKRSDEAPRPEMVRAIGGWARREHGVGLVGPLGFENAYAIALRPDTAARLGLRSLDDLARAAPRLTFGSDLEFLERPEWAMLRRAYGLDFAATRSFAPTFMYAALESGQADAISAFSSDGRIAADGLVVLADPRQAIPGYDALLLVAPRRADDERFLAALRPLVGAIPVERMRQANLMVDRDRDKRSPAEAAAFLDAQIR